MKEPSQVRVKLAGGEQLTYDVAGGFLSIDANGVTVLAESATPATPDAH
jgi:F-type H+-transporting ATPase subunit epsilon